MNKLEIEILKLLENQPGLKGYVIANTLKREKKEINSILHGTLKSHVFQNNQYEWFLRSQQKKPSSTAVQQNIDSPLSLLTRYYLECLNHDDLGGVSEFAYNKSTPTYLELKSIPFIENTTVDLAKIDNGLQLIKTVNRDRNKKTVYLGYPVRLNYIESKKSSWTGYKVEPIFLFQVLSQDGKISTTGNSENKLMLSNRFKNIKKELSQKYGHS